METGYINGLIPLMIQEIERLFVILLQVINGIILYYWKGIDFDCVCMG